MSNSSPAIDPDLSENSALLDVKQVAAKLRCSPRHVYRLSDRGAMPPPVRLGGLVRWPNDLIDRWIAQGCPAQQRVGR